MCLNDRPLAQGYPAQGRPEILDRLDAHPEPEGYFQITVATANFFQSDFLVVDRHKDMGEGDISLGVKIEDKILRCDDLFADQYALTRIDATELRGFQQPTLHDQAFGGEILEDDEIVVPVGQELFPGGEILEGDIALCRITEAQHLQRGYPLVEKFRISLIVGIELIDNVDGLRRHAEFAHEIMIGRHLFGLEAGSVDEVEELDSEQNFSVIT